MILSVVIIVLAIALWGAVHSWLASLGAKAAVPRSLGEVGSRGYRLLYNLFALVTFVPILLLVGLLPDRILYLVRPPFEYLMFAAQFLALLGLLVAVYQTDALGFVGLKQLMGQDESPALVTAGLYRYMRHPMYFFALLIIWLTPIMTMNLLVACIGLTAYLFIGAHYEERKLSRIFGRPYDEYKARTPMMIPLLMLGRRSAKAKSDDYA
jgi:protein-S-isoprenylcysteine O-methyltransferase Ste14